MKIMQSLAIAAVLGTAALTAPSASAADFGLSVNVGNGYSDGYYDSVWVPPVYRTEYYYGQPRLVIVVPGYYNRVLRPHYHNQYYGNNSYYSGRGSSYYGSGSGSYYGRSYNNRGHDHNSRGNDRGHDNNNRNNHNDRRR